MCPSSGGMGLGAVVSRVSLFLIALTSVGLISIGLSDCFHWGERGLNVWMGELRYLSQTLVSCVQGSNFILLGCTMSQCLYPPPTSILRLVTTSTA